MSQKEHHIEMIREGQVNIFEAEYQAKKQEALKMVEQAIDKLEKEMTVNRVHPYLLAIGNFLVDYVKANPSTAEKILAENKTIIGSMKEMRKEAEKVKVGNCAVLTDDQGFEIVLKYYGIKKAAVSNTGSSTSVTQTNEPKTTNPAPLSSEVTPRFVASLDEFL